MRDLFKKLRGSNKMDDDTPASVEQAPVQEAAGEQTKPVSSTSNQPDSESIAEKGIDSDEQSSSEGAKPDSDGDPVSESSGEGEAIVGDKPDDVVADLSVPDDPLITEDLSIPEELLVTEPGVIDMTRPVPASIEQTAITTKTIVTTGKAVKEVTAVIRAVQRCNIGKVRSRNEDSSFIFTAEADGQEPLPPFGLYVVADGMGGHHAGHEASRNVSRIVAQHVLEKIYLPILRTSTSTPGAPQEPISEVMLNAVQTANQRIHSPDPEKDSGSTLTAALVFGQRLYIAHVGDSRAYLLADDTLKQLTTDHSYVRRLQDAGQLTEAEAAIHPQRNMLYKAVGQGGDLEIDAFTQSLPRQGKLFLCSDGHWGLVPDGMSKHVLQQDIPLTEMADQLVKLALQGGGYDNITVIIVDFNF